MLDKPTVLETTSITRTTIADDPPSNPQSAAITPIKPSTELPETAIWEIAGNPVTKDGRNSGSDGYWRYLPYICWPMQGIYPPNFYGQKALSAAAPFSMEPGILSLEPR